MFDIFVVDFNNFSDYHQMHLLARNVVGYSHIYTTVAEQKNHQGLLIFVIFAGNLYSYKWVNLSTWRRPVVSFHLYISGISSNKYLSTYFLGYICHCYTMQDSKLNWGMDSSEKFCISPSKGLLYSFGAIRKFDLVNPSLISCLYNE